MMIDLIHQEEILIVTISIEKYIPTVVILEEVALVIMEIEVTTTTIGAIFVVIEVEDHMGKYKNLLCNLIEDLLFEMWMKR